MTTDGLQVKVRDFVTRSVSKVFETMLKMKLEVLDSSGGLSLEGDRVVGAVGFAGLATGVVYLQVTDPFGQILTNTLFGRKIATVSAPEEVNDVVGELSNMIGGNLKSYLSDYGLPCALSIPFITRGQSFAIQTKDGAWCERFAFRYQEHLALVQLCMKTN